MKNILVTGGAGFIGAYLVDRLACTGHTNITVIDNLRRGRESRIHHHIDAGVVRFVEADIRDRDALRAAMTGRELIYHLAAQSNVMGAVADAEYSFSTNVFGTFNVLQCAAELGVRRVVFTSSREVYGDAAYLPVDEEHPLRPKNPYGASKAAGEAYCSSFASSCDLDVAVVRLANVYGIGDRDRVIPLWLEAAAAGRDLQVYGGNQVLDFVWIDTVVDALVLAGERGLDETVNIGSGIGTSILELASRVLDVTGRRNPVVRLPARGPEVGRFVADTRRMRRLGLTPHRDPLARLGDVAAACAIVPV